MGCSYCKVIEYHGIKSISPHKTIRLEENALIKARAVAEASGIPAMADDSGLEVDYMDKAPGIYSARFLGEDTSYRIKNQYIIIFLHIFCYNNFSKTIHRCA